MAGRITRFLAETGMRKGEACGLERAWVSIPRREVRLTRTKTFESGRSTKLGGVCLHPTVGIEDVSRPGIVAEPVEGRLLP